jgi:hypothetical protein
MFLVNRGNVLNRHNFLVNKEVFLVGGEKFLVYRGKATYL